MKRKNTRPGTSLTRPCPGALNYSLDPELNQVKGARFSAAGLSGVLGKYGIKIEG